MQVNNKGVYKMKKHIPNMISCVRIIGALILLLFFNEFSPVFY